MLWVWWHPGIHIIHIKAAPQFPWILIYLFIRSSSSPSLVINIVMMAVIDATWVKLFSWKKKTKWVWSLKPFILPNKQTKAWLLSNNATRSKDVFVFFLIDVIFRPIWVKIKCKHFQRLTGSQVCKSDTLIKLGQVWQDRIGKVTSQQSVENTILKTRLPSAKQVSAKAPNYCLRLMTKYWGWFQIMDKFITLGDFFYKRDNHFHFCFPSSRFHLQKDLSFVKCSP